MHPDDETNSQRLTHIRELLATLPCTEAQTIAQVSQELGTSPRTLQRRLSEGNLTFRQLSAEVRLKIARDLLRRTDMPIQDIAATLGYRKPGAFTRAFVRWTDVTPSDYRRNHRSTVWREMGRTETR